MAASIPIPFVALQGVRCHRLLHGLWQTSGGWGKIDAATAVAAMASLHAHGYSTFDLADHYGPAEDLIGALNDRLRAEGAALPSAFTKWVPRPRAHTAAEVTAAIQKSLTRMRVPALDMLQFHWWDYGMRAEMMGVLRALDDLRRAGVIRTLALTNFDTAHVQLFLDAGIPIASNQVQFSVVDMRPAARMAPYCAAHGVGLLCYGTLGGGFITDAWLGKPEPRKAEVTTPSLGKYLNMIRAWGGWDLFQQLLRALRRVADRHAAGTTIAQVATKFILDQPAVAGVIIGLRAGISEHSAENARVFDLVLTEADVAEITAVQRKAHDLMAVIGDCGDEYRG